MAVRIFRFTDQYESGTAPRSAIPQSIGEGWIFDDAIFGLRKTLRIEREYASPHKSCTQIYAAVGIYEHIERNGQAVRRDFELLGENRAGTAYDTSTIGIFLTAIICNFVQTLFQTMLLCGFHRKFLPQADITAQALFLPWRLGNPRVIELACCRSCYEV